MTTITAQKTQKRTTVRPLVQLAFIITSMSIIFYTLNRRLNRFVTTDPTPPVLYMTPESYRSFGGDPTDIQVGLYVSKFSTFSVVNNSFDFTAILWFVGDPDAVSLETLQKFVFERGKIVYRSSPDTRLIDGKLFVRYIVRVELNNPFNYENFPLDNHRINLIVANPFVSPSEVLFSATENTFVMQAETRAEGWQLIDKSAATGYEMAQLDPTDERKTMNYPVAVFALDYARYGMRFVLSILMPLLLLFYLALFSLSWGTQRGGYGGLNMALGSITATLGYRFVIENLSPKTGYFTLADYLFFLFLVANVFIFFVALVDLYARKIGLWEKRAALILLHLFVTGSCVYLFLFWA